jgi:ketosteroid isomerase-like protein
MERTSRRVGMTDDDRELRRLVDERSCERLVVEYAWLIDSGAASRVADLVTEGATWTGADGGGMVGREEIRRAFEGRERLARRLSRHVVTNLRIDVEDDDHASGTACLVQYRHDAADGPAVAPAAMEHPKFVGDYHLTFVRTVEGWRIDSLRFELAFLRQRRDDRT